MNKNTFVDERDGKTYATVQLNGKTWFAQNLNFEVENSWWYEDLESNGDKWGRLYTWDAAQKACPDGWRLPTKEEWDELVESLGGYDKAYNALIDGSESMIKLTLGGYRKLDGYFGRKGAFGGYWASTKHSSVKSMSLNLDGYHLRVDCTPGLIESGRYCRLVKI